MAILPRSGRAALAWAIKDQRLHMAWGTGDASWPEDESQSPPPENPDAIGLLNEVGRRTITRAEFLVPDENGLIDIPEAGIFSVSTEPTHLLYIQTRFEFGHASDQVIRELGVFVNTIFVDGLPPGQIYFTPDEIVDGGMLLQLENIKPIYRSEGTRETFEMLIVL